MIENGKIYKYINLINGKIYIGQTTQSLEQRHKKHLSQLSDNTYFHRAIKKYGIENFKMELIEDKIPFKELDNREKFWINYYESFYVYGKGYNLTEGGQYGSGIQKISSAQAATIQQEILTSKKTFQEIAAPYGVTIYCISDINRGRTFFNESLKYPLRKAPEKSFINEDKINIIIDLLCNSTKNMTDIALMTDVKEYTIGEINRGKNSWCPKDLEYPLRKPIKTNTYQNTLNQDKVIEICRLLCFTNITLEEIGKIYGVAKNTVGDISRGISWKEITQQFNCPIRKNKLINQEIYHSIYGIV